MFHTSFNFVAQTERWLPVLKLASARSSAPSVTHGGFLMKRSFSFLLVIGVLACLVALPAGLAQEPQVVRIPMRDGIKLVGDLYLPEGSGPFPTLLTKTPYPRERRARRYRDFVSHGYAVLIVSMRGRFGSEGIFYQCKNEGWLEHPDGYDTIEWAAEQPWSTGKIGTFGTSSLAQWQLTTAPTRPSHLVAMFVSYPANHRYQADHVIRRGPGWYYGNQAMARPLGTREDWMAWLAAWKETRLPLIASFLHPELVDHFIHTAYDDHWRDIDPSTRYADFDVPIYHEGGWYDSFRRWTLHNFAGIRQQARSGKARRSQKLIMGPWTHGGGVPRDTGPITFGPQARIDRLALHLRWFDYWLKGIDTGILEEPPVRVYVMGAERWLEADTWPLPDTRSVRYYLRAGGGPPTGSLNDGRLLRERPGSEAPDEYLHDPYNPIPTIGEAYRRGGPGGPQDQRPVEARTLTFTTEPLEEDVAVVGEVRVRFFASSSAVDTDFFLTLTDVFPNGYSAILRRNGIR
ncbi:CocE/NonD family hydrolase, partial [Acidobacteria bacterium AH-259-L09]|nr:CocE/NonD family hydrolase [Acidobacteria bacterium AH-259-L09]